MIALIDLQGIAQRAGGSGNDRDLLHRRGVGLHGGHKRMADFVIGHDVLFLVGQDRALLLIAGDNGFDARLKVFLRRRFPVVADCAKRGLVDDVGKLRAGSAGGHAGDHRVINIAGRLDLLRVDLQNGFAALEIRQLHRNLTVKAARTGQGGVEGLGPVCGGQNNHAGISFKAVHLGQQLVERLFALVVSADL